MSRKILGIEEMFNYGSASRVDSRNHQTLRDVVLNCDFWTFKAGQKFNAVKIEVQQGKARSLSFGLGDGKKMKFSEFMLIDEGFEFAKDRKPSAATAATIMEREREKEREKGKEARGAREAKKPAIPVMEDEDDEEDEEDEEEYTDEEDEEDEEDEDDEEDEEDEEEYTDEGENLDAPPSTEIPETRSVAGVIPHTED